jgi:uncharacterized protein (TIGR03067 family)
VETQCSQGSCHERERKCRRPAQQPRPGKRGTWKLVSLEVNGEKATKGEIKKERRLVVEDDRFHSTVDDKHTFKGTFKLDPSPKAVDVVVTEGEFKGKTLLGIYRWRGTLCGPATLP